MKNEQLKITVDNYKGYCELYKTRYFPNKKISDKIFKYEIILMILVILFAILNLHALAISLFLITLGTPSVIKLKNINDESKKIKTKYQNINTKVNELKLRQALIESKILKYKNDGNYTYRYLDTKGYIESIENEKNKNEVINKCERIKEEVINKSGYVIVQNDYTVPLEELEKVKSKIKVLKK